MASRGRFHGHRSWLQLHDESVVISASILLPNSHHFSHDRGPGRSSIAIRSNGGDSTT